MICLRFYSDIEANYGVWDGKKMLHFENGVYETDDQKEIDLLIKAGCRHDDIDPPVEKKTNKRTGK